MNKETTPTTTAVATGATLPAKVSVIHALAGKLECDETKLAPLLKKTAFATCRTDEEFQAMCMVANTYNLNPILKEIYAFPAKNGSVIPIVSVDGWIELMNSNPAFDGIEFEEPDGACTAIIHRKDRAHPIRVTEYLSECKGSSEPWNRWPKRMLRHKAMIQAARIAFGFAGIYDEDEGRRIASVAPVVAVGPSPLDEPQGATVATSATLPTNGDRLRERLGVGKPKPKPQDALLAPEPVATSAPLPPDEGEPDDSDVPY